MRQKASLAARISANSSTVFANKKGFVASSSRNRLGTIAWPFCRAALIRARVLIKADG